MARLRTLDDLDLQNRRVVVRADLNVPLENGVVRDATRIERLIPTLERLLGEGALIVVLSHFGRPAGKVVPQMSLAPVAPALAKALGHPVRFVETDWRDDRAAAAVADAHPGDILLMENTRFHPGETANDETLAARFAALGDAFVNDAFSVAHRAHASTVGIAKLLPSAAGLAMAGEIAALQSCLDDPVHPVVALVGGAKISSKLPVLEAISRKVDTLIIGGGMDNTFLAALDKPVGKSLCEHDLTDTARQVLNQSMGAGCTVILPDDVVVAREFKANAGTETLGVDEVGADDMILDVGPRTVDRIIAIFEQARTLLWNGPLGAFETTPFDAGTNAAARAAARFTESGKLTSVAGGGDTVAALANAGVVDRFSYVSTAGGAFLEWLEGRELPSVAVLQG